MFYIEISEKNEEKTEKYKIKIDYKTTETNLKFKCYIKPIFRTVIPFFVRVNVKTAMFKLF